MILVEVQNLMPLQERGKVINATDEVFAKMLMISKGGKRNISWDV